MPQGAQLPRRALLGLRLPADSDAFAAQGMRIRDVVPGGTAAAAGVRAGDLVEHIAGIAPSSVGALSRALRRAGQSPTVTFAVRRDDTRLDLEGPTQRAPRESDDAFTSHYEHITRDGHRLRTIVTVPRDRPARGAILCVQGIACESIEDDGGPMRCLVGLFHAWARAGFVTMRMDKRGVGDSEGDDCASLDFDTELDDMRAAAATWCSDPRTRNLPLYVFGHSVGGMMVPMLQPPRALAGVMVAGTSTVPWLDCVEASTRRQLGLRGHTPDAIDAHIADLRTHIATHGLNGRSPAYHAQLDAIDLETAWRSAHVKRLLILRGEHDWIVDPTEQAALADLVGDGDATVRDLPGTDHLLARHPDRAASLANYGSGAWSPAPVDASLEWLTAAAVD